MINAQNFIVFSKIASEENWNAVFERVENLLNIIDEQRQEDLATVANYSNETFFDVHIYYRKSPADQAKPLGVVIREKGDDGAAIKFELGVAGYVFRALLEARKNEQPFIRLKDLVELTNKMANIHKASIMDGKIFDEHTIRNHIRNVRNLISQNAVKLKYEHTEIEATSYLHEEKHQKGVFCANCIIQHGEKEPLKGYRLSATLTKERIVDSRRGEDFNDVFLDEAEGELIGI